MSDPEWKDLIGTGAVRKKIIKEGDGPNPEYLQIAYIHWQGKIAKTGTIFHDSRDDSNGEPIDITVGDQVLDEVVPGIMLAVRLMKCGEIADVEINSRFAYGPVGLKPHVAPDEDLMVRVELVSIGERQKAAVDMSPDELVETCTKYKDRGNYFFRLDNIPKALQCYQDALKKAESHLPQRDEDGNVEIDEYLACAPLQELRGQLAGNAAACFEKMDKTKEAKDACVAALAIDPTNLKVLLRAARLSIQDAEYQEASRCLATANEAHPNNPQVKALSKTLRVAIAEYKSHMKDNYQGFLKPAQAVETSNQAPKDPEHEQPNASDKPVAKENLETMPSFPTAPTTPSNAKAPLLPHREKPKPVSFLARALQLCILLAPTLIAVFIFAFVPTVNASSVSWKNIRYDVANEAISKLGLDTLVCEGKNQRPSCCVCVQAMNQVIARQALVSDVHRGRKVEIGGFRMDKSESRHIPYEQSEEVLVSMLDNLCARLPIDVPKRIDDVKRMKIAVSKACFAIIDKFYDSILAVLRKKSSWKGRELRNEVCGQVVGVCSEKLAWDEQLLSLGDGYQSLPCKVCKLVSSTLVENAALITEDSLRTPGTLCSLKTNIPRSETRLNLVSETIGNACIDLVYENRLSIVEILKSNCQGPENTTFCVETLLTLLCEENCNPTRIERVELL